MSIQVEELEAIREKAWTVVTAAKMHCDWIDLQRDIVELVLAERERATRVQIEKDAEIAHETVKPIMAGNFGLVHVAEIGRQIAEAIRSQLTGG